MSARSLSPLLALMVVMVPLGALAEVGPPAAVQAPLAPSSPVLCVTGAANYCLEDFKDTRCDAVACQRVNVDNATNPSNVLDATPSDANGRGTADPLHWGRHRVWTQANLDPDAFAAVGHDHDPRYFTRAESDARFLPLLGKAADADRLDGLDAQDLQRRITGACGGGFFLRAVNGDGSVVCAPDQGTTYAAGNGLSLAGTVFSLLGCAPGQVLKADGAGAWGCAQDADSGRGGTVTSVGSGSGLTGGPITGSGTLGLVPCASGQVLKAGSAGAWACAADEAGSSPWLDVPGGIAYAAGRVGIGTASPGATLEVAGNAAVSGRLRLGDDATPCTAAEAGALRWNGSAFLGCDGASWVRFAIAASTTVLETFDLYWDWMTTQDSGSRIQYLEASGDNAGLSLLTSYDPGLQRWSRGGALPILDKSPTAGKVLAHPEGDAGRRDLVVRYRVQHAGAAVVSGTVAKENPACGDGVAFLLYHNGSEIRRIIVPYNDPTGAPFSSTVSVAAGDAIHFQVAPNGNGQCDYVRIQDFRITVSG